MAEATTSYALIVHMGSRLPSLAGEYPLRWRAPLDWSRVAGINPGDWSPEVKASLAESAGYYAFCDLVSEKVLYVGKSGNIRERFRNYCSHNSMNTDLRTHLLNYQRLGRLTEIGLFVAHQFERESYLIHHFGTTLNHNLLNRTYNTEESSYAGPIPPRNLVWACIPFYPEFVQGTLKGAAAKRYGVLSGGAQAPIAYTRALIGHKEVDDFYEKMILANNPPSTISRWNRDGLPLQGKRVAFTIQPEDGYYMFVRIPRSAYSSGLHVSSSETTNGLVIMGMPTSTLEDILRLNGGEVVYIGIGSSRGQGIRNRVLDYYNGRLKGGKISSRMHGYLQRFDYEQDFLLLFWAPEVDIEKSIISRTQPKYNSDHSA